MKVRTKFRVKKLLRLGIMMLMASPVAQATAPPAWWYEYLPSDPDLLISGGGPLDTALSTHLDENNLAIANVGQAKWMATRAIAKIATIDEVLAQNILNALKGEGGALSGEGALAPAENITDAKKVLTVGALKAIVAPFYDQLHGGYPLGVWLTRNGLDPMEHTHQSGKIYPWTEAFDDDSNRSPATIGQLKVCFSFWFNDEEAEIDDADRDGLSDLLESALGFDPNLEASVLSASKGGDREMFRRLRQGAERADPDGVTFPYGVYESPSAENVSRFLAQASWGANRESIQAFIATYGDQGNPYESWIDDQLKTKFSGEQVDPLAPLDPLNPNANDPFPPFNHERPIIEVAMAGQVTITDEDSFLSYRPYLGRSYWRDYVLNDEGSTPGFNPALVEVNPAKVDGFDADALHPDQYVTGNPGHLRGYLTSWWARSPLDSIDFRFFNANKSASVEALKRGDHPEQPLCPVPDPPGSPDVYCVESLSGFEGGDLSSKAKAIEDEIDIILSAGIALTDSGYCNGKYIAYDSFLNRHRPVGLPCLSFRPAYDQHTDGFSSKAVSTRMTVSYPHSGTANLPQQMATAWMCNVVHGENVLRQRVAFALSQILVVSGQNPGLNGAGMGLAHYYDMLADHAFGNYSTLLKGVTFHPVMGQYLTYLDSSGAGGAAPDENYAREILQLFSVGLYELDPNGVELFNHPFYTQDDIKELSRVFTGFHVNGREFLASNSGGSSFRQHYGFQMPMSIDVSHHDQDEKTLSFLSEEGTFGITANTDPKIEVETVVEKIAKHRNVGFFIGKRLIQHLVTSNPSQEYIQDVADVFNNAKDDDDQLGQVVKAILLHSEARAWTAYLKDSDQGKLRSPLLRSAQIAKVLNAGKNDKHGHFPSPAGANNGYTVMGDLQWSRALHVRHTKQSPLYAPSVFNFYEPTYRAPEITVEGRVSPEFQIVDGATALAVPNLLGRYISDQNFETFNYRDTEPFIGVQVNRYLLPYSLPKTDVFNGFHSFDNSPWMYTVPNPNNDPGIEPDGSGDGLRFASDAQGALSVDLDDGFAQTEGRVERVDAFLDEVNMLFANGRLSAVTRKYIRDAVLDEYGYGQSTEESLNAFAIQILCASPDVAVLK